MAVPRQLPLDINMSKGWREFFFLAAIESFHHALSYTAAPWNAGTLTMDLKMSLFVMSCMTSPIIFLRAAGPEVMTVLLAFTVNFVVWRTNVSMSLSIEATLSLRKIFPPLFCIFFFAVCDKLCHTFLRPKALACRYDKVLFLEIFSITECIYGYHGVT